MYILREKGHKLVLGSSFGQILKEKNLVGRQVFVWHLDIGPLRCRSCGNSIHYKGFINVQIKCMEP